MFHKIKNKKAIIIIAASTLVLLAAAPWMNNKSIQNDILQKYGRQDGSIDKNGNLFCDYEARWLPFGRWVVSCEGGYFVPFFYFNKNGNKNIQEQQVFENNKTLNNTTDWKTYRNEEYGFEFKYPKGWEKSKMGNFFTISPSVNVLQLNFENKDSKTTLSDFVSNFMKENDCKSVDFPNEGDHVIETTTTGIYYVGFCAISSEVYHYATEINDNLILDFSYKDDFSDNSSEGEKIKVFKEIISTFKFTK